MEWFVNGENSLSLNEVKVMFYEWKVVVIYILLVVCVVDIYVVIGYIMVEVFMENNVVKFGYDVW